MSVEVYQVKTKEGEPITLRIVLPEPSKPKGKKRDKFGVVVGLFMLVTHTLVLVAAVKWILS